MAYNSAHTGPEIDAAVQLLGEIQEAKDTTAADRQAVTGMAATVASQAAQVNAQAAQVSSNTAVVLASASAVEADRAEVEQNTGVVLSAKTAAQDAGAAAVAAQGAIEVIQESVSQAQIAAEHSEQSAGDSASAARADREQVELLAQQTAEDSASAAESAAAAAAVVTGGTATLNPEPGKIPLAKGDGKIDEGWLPAEIARISSVEAVTEQVEIAIATAEAAEARTDRYLMPTDTTPELRDNGLPLELGDVWFNTADQTEYIYKTAGWRSNDSLQAVDSLTLSLSDSTNPNKGAALSGFEGGTVAGALLASKKMASYAALRNYSGAAQRVEVTQSGIAGAFIRQASADGFSDDGGVTIVGAYAWVRDYNGIAQVSWFGALGKGADETLALQRAHDSSMSVCYGRGSYSFATLTIRQGTKLAGLSRTETKLQVTGAGIVIVNAGIKLTTSITDLTLMPMSAGLASGIRSDLTDFFNLNAVEIHRVDIKGPDSDAGGYGLRTPNYYFLKNIDSRNMNKLSLVDTNVTGGYKIEADPTLQAKTYGVYTAGTSIGIHMSDFNVKCVETAWEFGDNVEGFWISSCEWIYVRRGINGNTTTSKPGGWVDGLHINCALSGIHLRQRNVTYLAGVSVLRASFYYPEATWDGIILDDCRRYTVSDYCMRPDFTGNTGVKKGISIIGGIGGQLGKGSIAYMTQGISVSGGNNGFDVGEPYLESCSTNVVITSDCIDVKVGDFKCNGARLVTNSSPSTRFHKNNGFYTVDSSVRAINAAGSETFQQAISKRLARLRLDAGTGAYTYNIIMSNVGAIEGDIFEVSVRMAPTNPTLTFTADGAVTQTIPPPPNQTSYYVKMAFTSSVWRCVAACQSLHA
ncbi:hypothetical protein [Pseudomonas shirazensis]|uniref:hypothetical protein n=1 Tax=Pseudomonas shirazensis TaxID=2745494 RepID=UPI003D27DF41